eukprot:tig00000361_g24419.t1
MNPYRTLPKIGGAASPTGEYEGSISFRHGSIMANAPSPLKGSKGNPGARSLDSLHRESKIPQHALSRQIDNMQLVPTSAEAAVEAAFRSYELAAESELRGAYTDAERQKVKEVFLSRTPAGRKDALLLEAWVKQQCEATAAVAQGDPLEAVEHELRVYTMAVHEIARQVSVGCVERGTLLATLWSRYTELLNRVHAAQTDQLRRERGDWEGTVRRAAEEQVRRAERAFEERSRLQEEQARAREAERQARIEGTPPARPLHARLHRQVRRTEEEVEKWRKEARWWEGELTEYRKRFDAETEEVEREMAEAGEAREARAAAEARGRAAQRALARARAQASEPPSAPSSSQLS